MQQSKYFQIETVYLAKLPEWCNSNGTPLTVYRTSCESLCIIWKRDNVLKYR